MFCSKLITLLFCSMFITSCSTSNKKECEWKCKDGQTVPDCPWVCDETSK